MEGTIGADGVPLFACPVAGVTRPVRCSYDPVAMAGRAIVVDNGSHTFRAGWAGEESPSVMFRSAIAKPRPKQGIPRTVVGDWGPGLSGWDFGKHTHRYCFENDVPINMEGEEAMLDWALDRMQITGSSVAHPLLITEAPLPPTGVRSQLAQLVFEAYGVPALSYVAAAPAAFLHHYDQAHKTQQQQQQRMVLGEANASELDQQQLCGSSSGLVICSGHSHSYVVPIYKGQPQWGASVRCWASGSASTGHLQQLLSVKYPLHAAGLLGNWQLVEGIKEGFCCAAADYRETLRAVAARPDIAGGMGLRVQLPYVEASQPTAVDLAVKAQAARARGKALADMRRRKVLEQKEEQLALMKEVKAGVEDAESEVSTAGGRAVQQLLRQAHVASQEELDKKITDLSFEVERLRAQLGVAAPPATAPADEGTAGGAAAAAMEVDQAANGLDAAAQAAAPVPVAAADSAAGTAATNTDTVEAGNEADIEQDDNRNDADTDSSSTVTVSDTAAAAARGAAGPTAAAALAQLDATATSGAAAAAAAAAAADNEDSEATADDDGNHSSSTVTDEGVFEQQGVLQEVLQQVKQIRKKQRQDVRRKVQQQERQQRRQQERQQQQMQQQQYEMEINYLGIPDSMLTAEQIKTKRRQQSMHAARMARERAAARKLQQQLEREQRMAIEDEQFAADPFTYLTFLQQRHNMTNSRIEARKRKRLGQATTAVEEETGADAGMAGKRRRDEKHRERMRLIAQAAAPTQKRDKKDKKGKDKKDKRHGDKLTKRDRKGSSSLDEEGFGDEAADWEVYRVMDIRGSDSEAEAEEAAELAWTTQRLQQIGAAVAAAAAAAVTAQAGTDAAVAAALQDDASTAAAASSRAASQEPPDINAAAAGSTLLDMAAAAVAGQLVTTAYPAAAAADGGSLQQQQQGLAGIDLNLLGLGGLGLGGEGQAQTQHLTAEDHQIFLGVERFRVPELLFQPMALAGVEQAGLSELVAVAMKRLPAHVAAEVACGGVVLTGGNLMFPGLVARIESELRSIRPPDQPMKIYTTKEPLLDTWRGAAALAAATGRTGPAAAAAVGFSGSQGSQGSDGFLFQDPFAAGNGVLSRALYEEAGVDYLKEFKGFKYPEL